MYDIDLLEKQWQRYNKRKKYPIYLIVAGLFLVGSLGYYFVISHNTINTKDADLQTLPVSEKKGKNYNILSNILVNQSLHTIDKYEIVSNNEMSRPKDNTLHAQANAPIQVVEDIPILDEKTVKPVEQIHNKKTKKKKKIVIHIQETSSISAYKDVERRFYQSHDIDDSLFLARGYYAKGDYKKAAYWALQTNKLNSQIDESWIIFIKSKVALGEKNEAIHILQSYIRKSNSYKARKLLNKLQN